MTVWVGGLIMVGSVLIGGIWLGVVNPWLAPVSAIGFILSVFAYALAWAKTVDWALKK